MNVKSAVFECGSVRTAVYVGLGAHQMELRHIANWHIDPGRACCNAKTAQQGRPKCSLGTFPIWAGRGCRPMSQSSKLPISFHCVRKSGARCRGAKQYLLDRLNECRLRALWIEALEAPHLYVQNHRSAHAGLSPELAPILTMPARTSARAPRAIRPAHRACRLDRQQRFCDIETDDSFADGAK
jgi:hypothetical protein